MQAALEFAARLPPSGAGTEAAAALADPPGGVSPARGHGPPMRPLGAGLEHGLRAGAPGRVHMMDSDSPGSGAMLRDWGRAHPTWSLDCDSVGEEQN